MKTVERKAANEEASDEQKVTLGSHRDIFLASRIYPQYNGTAPDQVYGVDDQELVKDISDHFPVYAVFRTGVQAGESHFDHPGWEEALDYPGARQMRHLRALMESRPCLDRIPDPDIITSDPGSMSKENPRIRQKRKKTYLKFTKPSPHRRRATFI